jgi:acetolactate synthase-1/2/3 large subunit
MSGTDGTVAEALARRLAEYGVRRIFGVPGGDCSLDLIDAGARTGIEFVATRTETAAAIMASVTAELTGTPGVLMTTRGPGLANAVNGIAYASLDRAPLLVLADGHEPGAAHASHQRFDQAALLRPLVKAESSLAEADPVAELDRLVAAARGAPPGPVYVELIGGRLRAKAPPATTAPVSPVAPAAMPDAAALDAARAVLAGRRRPIIIAGLQAAEPEAAAALRRLAAAWRCPVLTTYKAKGAADDADPMTVGCFIGGPSEEALIRAADAILLFGADPVEFLPTPWRHAAPVVELTGHAFAHPFLTPAASVVGDLAAAARELEAAAEAAWDEAAIAAARAGIRTAARAEATATNGIAPHRVVEAAAAAAPRATRIAVDAGAHMLPVMALWESHAPRDALISRGLATMGSALPAAIGASLAEPDRPVVAFTGDGGLMMCPAELGTAVQAGCRNLVVVVFNDAAMSLIEVKQARRGLAQRGMDYAPADFAAVARGFGCEAWRVEEPAALEPAMRAAFACGRPALVDVVVDRHAYHQVVRALRG